MGRYFGNGAGAFDECLCGGFPGGVEELGERVDDEQL